MAICNGNTWHTEADGKCSQCGCEIVRVEISSLTKQPGAVHATTGAINTEWANNWFADIDIPQGATQVRFQAFSSSKGYGSVFLNSNGTVVSGHTTTEENQIVVLDIPASACTFRYGQNREDNYITQAIEFAVFPVIDQSTMMMGYMVGQAIK